MRGLAPATRSTAATTLLALVLAGCGSLTPPRGSPGTEAPLVQSPTNSTVSSNCRLPVVGAAKIAEGGFLTFPGARFTADPASLQTYVAQAARWVPVPGWAVAPNGSAYAYAQPSAQLVHVVQLPSGIDTPFLQADPYRVIGFTSDGVYLSKGVANSDSTARGLFLMDPRTGAVSGLDGEQWTFAVAGGGWVWTYEGAGDNEILARSLVPGNMFYGNETGVVFDGTQNLQIIGFDGGGLPVILATTSTTYRIYTARSYYIGNSGAGFQQPPIFEGTPAGASNPTGPAYGDTNGVWFGSHDGSVWLYQPTSGEMTVQVRTQIQDVRVAGPCS